MILVAITGNVCSGKSFVSKAIGKFGHPVFSCDIEIHKILNQKEILNKVGGVFPQVICGGEIDKKLLAKIIFKCSKSRQALEDILYPLLFAKQDKFIVKYEQMGTEIAFFEVPLLYEKHLESKYSYVIATHSPRSVLVERARERGVDLEVFSNILKNQLPDKEKIKRADFVIDTTQSRAVTIKEVKKIINEILK